MSELVWPTTTALFDLVNIVDSLPADESPLTVNSNLDLVSRLANHDYLIPLLREIISDPPLLAEIASRSYRHVNYFDKIVLVDSPRPDGYRLTLHLWVPPFTDKELTKESLHDHRFSFWSAIVVGTLSSEDFIESSSGQIMQHYQYVPEERAGDSRNFYKFIGDTRLLKAKTLQRSAGESYFQPFFGVHRVLLPNSLSCTLVLRGPRKKTFTNTFRTDIPKLDGRVANVMFKSDTLEKKLRALLRSVERA
jgi:hypothetical protein